MFFILSFNIKCNNMVRLKFVLFFFILGTLVETSLLAQDSSWERYYKDVDLKKEKTEEKAKYMLSVITNDKDSIVEVLELKTEKIVSHEEFVRNRLSGKCFYWNDETGKADTIYYGKKMPRDHFLYDAKNKKLHAAIGEFINPQFIIDGEAYSPNKNQDISFINSWIAHSLQIPIKVFHEGISGIVYAQFSLDEQGKVGNVRIIKGAHRVLDLEAYRILTSLPAMHPAMLDSKPIKIFAEVPITFLF